jgi:anti-sigma B factor antagonist
MPNEPLTLEDTVDPAAGRRTIRLTGPLTISNLFDFQARVRANTEPDLILDFTGVPYIDSAGVGALVGAYVTHNKDGRSLALVGVSDRVRNVLAVTHVEQFFRFFDSLESATAA